MPQLHFTDVFVVANPVRPGGTGGQFWSAAVDTAGRPELVDGTPVILDDDGSYDLELNRVLRECPILGVRSTNSVRAYCRDLVTWARFLAERRGGKNVWKADRQDVIAFHRTRRLTVGPGQIAAASWNRSVTALETFYGWAWDGGSSRWDTVFSQHDRRTGAQCGAIPTAALASFLIPVYGRTTCASSAWTGS